MTAPGWMQAAKTVEVVRSRKVRAAPEELWSLVSGPDAELLSPYTALVLPVPGTEGRLSCAVDLWGGRTQARVLERLPSDQPRTSLMLDRTTGVAADVLVEPARAGCKVRRSVRCQVPRADARDVLLGLETLSTQWLERVTRVVEGFEQPPGGRLGALLDAQRVGPATASLRGSRTVPVPRAAIWSVLTRPGAGPLELHRFWTGPLSAGTLVCSIAERADGGLAAGLAEVTEVVPGERLSSRPVSGGQHPCLITWHLADAAGGTTATFEHACATSHVDLPDVVEAALDQLEQLLAVTG